MEILKVNKETCQSCGACAHVCPPGIIDFQDKTYPKSTEITENNCTICGHCVAVCPTGSLAHRDMAVEQCTPLRKDLLTTADQCEQFLRRRRSIRVYHEKPVPRDIITHLIEIARYAPTGHNSQTVQWMVVDNKEALRRFTDIGAEWMRWSINKGAASFKFPGQASWFEMMLKRYEKGENEFLRDSPALIVTHSMKDDLFAQESCTIALTYFDLAATNLGLGCCWLGLFNAAASNYPPMIEALGLPEGHKPFGSMAVGYSKYKYQRLPSRKEPPIIWHP